MTARGQPARFSCCGFVLLTACVSLGLLTEKHFHNEGALQTEGPAMSRVVSWGSVCEECGLSAENKPQVLLAWLSRWKVLRDLGYSEGAARRGLLPHTLISAKRYWV